MSSEKKWVVGGAESSDKPDSDQQNQNKGVSQNARWVQPPLPRSELFGAFNQRKSFIEAPVRPPLPLEKIDVGEDDDDDEEDEEKEAKKTSTATSIDAEAVDEVLEAPDVVAGAENIVEASAEANVADNADLKQGEVFEPIVPSASKDAELMDMPHADKNESASASPTFEEIMSREMSADFVRETSGDTLGGPDKRDIPPIPSWEMPAVGSRFDPAPGEEPYRRPTPVTPFSVPSWGTGVPGSFEAGGYTSSSGSESTSRSGGEVSSGFTAALEALKAAADLAELASNPNRMVARVLTEVAVSGYLARRKEERYSNEPLLRKQQELNDQQRIANERLNAIFQQQAEQVAQTQEIFDQNGNRIVLQPGWRVERSAGGYSVVVDKHNRVIHDAIRYGEAFKREQQREQLSDDVFAAARGGSAGGAQDDSGLVSAVPPVAGTGQGGSAADPQSLLGYQPAQVDLDHRLPAPRKPIREAALNPWLWTAVAILIIIYFVASLA